MKRYRFASFSFTIGLFLAAITGFGDTVNIEIDTSAAAGVIKPFLGVNGGPYMLGEPENPHVREQYTELGITMIRTHDFYGPVDMDEMYPDNSADPDDPANYNFTESNLRLEMAVENGHEIYLRIGNSWNYGGTPPTNIPNYIEAAKNVVRHYTEGLWDGYTFDIRYIEAWNEPGNQHFWTGTRPQFLIFFEQMVKELKAEFPAIKIGGPGFLPTGYKVQDESNYPRILLTHCQENDVPLDFLSWHMYSNDPDDYSGAGLFYRNLLDEFGYTEAESHITEWNTEEGAERYNAHGAAVMTGAWIELQDGQVDVSTFFRGQDSNITLPTYYGLMYADGTYKKVGYAFQAWRRMTQHPLRLPVTIDTANIRGIAGFSEDGNSLAILLSHYSVDGIADTVDRYDLEVPQWLPAVEGWKIQRYGVSAIHDLGLLEDGEILPSGGIFTLSNPLPTNSVELILLTQERAPTGILGWDLF